MTLVDEHGIENVNKSFVDEEGFEEEGDDGSSLAKDKESSIKPCEMAMEDC